MATTPVEYPEIDFATDAVPNLHEVLADLRERHAVAPVRYHGATAYLITRFGDLRSAMADDEAFPSWAAYARHTEPVMGRTIQCMGGDEHRRNRGLVSAAFRPRLMTEFVEAFLTPVAHQLVNGIRMPVDVTFRRVDDRAFGFRVGAFDRTRPLVIDPAVFSYSGYVGGGGQEVNR